MTDEIKTGIETDRHSDAQARDIDPDVWAFADDGEYAVSFGIERVSPSEMRIETHFHEAGLDVVFGDVETKTIRNTPMSTEAIAREKAENNANRKTMNMVRDFFENDRSN